MQLALQMKHFGELPAGDHDRDAERETDVDRCEGKQNDKIVDEAVCPQWLRRKTTDGFQAYQTEGK